MVTEIVAAECTEQDEVLRLAAAEWDSEHPLGKAIVRKAHGLAIEVPPIQDFEAIPGHGVQTQVDGKLVRFGKRQFSLDHDVALKGLEKEGERLAHEGQTRVYVSVADKAIGLIAVTDAVKASAHTAVEALHAMGIDVAMITGDHGHTAAVIARQVAIDRVLAEAYHKARLCRSKSCKLKGG